jgi:hypothetical protein
MMNSILGSIFLAVQARLTTQVPALRWIDQDMGQLEVYTGDRPPVAFPSSLLDIVSINYSDCDEGIQICQATLEVRLAVAAYAPSAHVHQLSQKERALYYFDLEHEVNRVLHGWSTDGLFSPLTRASSQTEKREDNIRVRPLRYTFSFTDNTAVPLPAFTVPRPDLELETELNHDA